MRFNRLFIITGDFSGDIHAGKVVEALRQSQPDIKLAAVGGMHLKALGVNLISDQSRMGQIGFGSFLGAPYHALLGRRILHFLKQFRPQAVLLIDYGVFNLYMAALIKKLGIKIFYFIPPQVWATRRGRIKKIKAHVDHVFCIFPFEEELYRAHGIPVTYVGHPLVGELPAPANREAFCQEHGLSPEQPIVGLFPGSRKLEINYLLPEIIGSLPRILEHHPDTQFVLAKASSLEDSFFIQRFERANQCLPAEKKPRVHLITGQNHAILSVSDLIIAASGTVTLEAALYKTPMVIMYKLFPLVYQVAIRIAYLPCIGLPNILTDMHNPIVPELWQDKANPQTISETVRPLFDRQSVEVQKALRGFEQIQLDLNVGNAAANVAEGILTLMSSFPEVDGDDRDSSL